MKLRFNKAAFYFGRVKYGYMQPIPNKSRPVPGAGTLRRLAREAATEKLNREKYGW